MTLNEARQKSLTADQSDALLAVVISLHIHVAKLVYTTM